MYIILYMYILILSPMHVNRRLKLEHSLSSSYYNNIMIGLITNLNVPTAL